MEVILLEDYKIYIGDFWQALANFLDQGDYSKVVVLVDNHTKKHCFPLLQEKLPQQTFHLISIAAGEEHKNIETCQYIWGQMMDLGIDRKSLAINLGGGVIGDMGGFCARTFNRGIDFIQIPTTILSQVDASIGGKLGIDFKQIKNSIGVFNNPKGVFISPKFYQTLPKAEIRSGFAEIIKHSLIADQKQWQSIQETPDFDAIHWPGLLPPSLHIKKSIVAADPHERGLRKALNFGHTIGHAIEGFALESERQLLHGEAVAIGMICESYLSHLLLGLSKKELQQICTFILKIYSAYPLDKDNYPAYLQLMAKDKKNENGVINFSLIGPIGQVHVNQTASDKQILESLEFYNSLIQ